MRRRGWRQDACLASSGGCSGSAREPSSSRAHRGAAASAGAVLPAPQHAAQAATVVPQPPWPTRAAAVAPLPFHLSAAQRRSPNPHPRGHCFNPNTRTQHTQAPATPPPPASARAQGDLPAPPPTPVITPGRPPYGAVPESLADFDLTALAPALPVMPEVSIDDTMALVGLAPLVSNMLVTKYVLCLNVRAVTSTEPRMHHVLTHRPGPAPNTKQQQINVTWVTKVLPYLKGLDSTGLGEYAKPLMPTIQSVRGGFHCNYCKRQSWNRGAVLACSRVL